METIIKRKVQLSNVELLLALISERTKKGYPLQKSDILQILEGNITPETEPFDKVKFDYESGTEEEEILFDISTLIGIGSVDQRREDNPGIIYVVTESGEMDLEKLENVLRDYELTERAINSFEAKTSIFE